MNTTQTYNKAEQLQIAKTILEQLGGHRLVAMTGAKNLMALDGGLQLRLPSNFAKDGINCVRVQLTPMDDYTVTFSKIRGTSVKEVAKHEGAYAEDLNTLFVEVTGLATRLS